MHLEYDSFRPMISAPIDDLVWEDAAQTLPNPFLKFRDKAFHRWLSGKGILNSLEKKLLHYVSYYISLLLHISINKSINFFISDINI